MIQAKTEALAQASMKLGEAVYKASAAEAPTGDAAGPGASGGSAGGGADDPKVVDADFEEVDERKKGHQA